MGGAAPPFSDVPSRPVPSVGRRSTPAPLKGRIIVRWESEVAAVKESEGRR